MRSRIRINVLTIAVWAFKCGFRLVKMNPVYGSPDIKWLLAAMQSAVSILGYEANPLSRLPGRLGIFEREFAFPSSIQTLSST